MTTKKPVEPEEPVTGELVRAAVSGVARDKDHLSQYLGKEAEDAETSALQTHAAIIHQILSSPTVDSVLEVFEPQTLADFENRHLRIDSIRWQESEFDEGPTHYVSIMVVDVDADTRHLINCGEQRVMAQLLKLEEFKAFPVDVVVVLSKRPNRFNRRMAALSKWEAPRG